MPPGSRRASMFSTPLLAGAERAGIYQSSHCESSFIISRSCCSPSGVDSTSMRACAARSSSSCRLAGAVARFGAGMSSHSESSCIMSSAFRRCSGVAPISWAAFRNVSSFGVRLLFINSANCSICFNSSGVKLSPSKCAAIVIGSLYWKALL